MAEPWQCPGCGTYYAWWVHACRCAKRTTTASTAKTSISGVDYLAAVDYPELAKIWDNPSDAAAFDKEVE